MQREFPDINIRKRLIRCYNKQLLSGLDILVDDYEKNLIDGDYLKVLLDKPWNQNSKEYDNEHQFYRTTDWRNIYELIYNLS